METVQGFVDKVRVATAHDSVYNSECCYTFFNDDLLVNLETFLGTTLAFAAGNSINVRIVRVRREKEHASADQPTKLAIGVEGGFDVDKYETITTYSVVVVGEDPRTSCPFVVDLAYSAETKDQFPEKIQQSVDSIIHHAGVGLQQEVQAWQADTDEIPVSKYASNLPFVGNGVKIDPNPSSWKCEKSGATENLWLNLSDGYIGGGRKNWDGSGGSNGALDHFEETGKQYPLVVKLGTLTSDLDTADCYSYAPDEDGPVRIPNLAELLVKRGINIGDMQKTVKSTAELEVELNANYAFDAITEAGEDLQAVSGPGLQGIQNLGNSCYMNSVFQMLLSGTVPELAKRYGGMDVLNHPFLTGVSPATAATDVFCQTAKLGLALTSGAYAVRSEDDPNKYRIAPRMMKHCIGKDHVDFRTAQQQDAAQFLQYFLEKLDRAEIGAGVEKKSSHLFSFNTTTRLECSADSKVKYTESSGPETVWSLRIPMDKAFVEEDVSPDHKRLKADDETKTDKKPVPTITLQTCIKEWCEPTVVEGLRWPHLDNASHPATQTLLFSNFPRYIIVQLQRYQLGPDWTPVKLEVNVDVPQELDLNEFKTTGPKEGEELIPDDDKSKEANNSSKPVIDEGAVEQLMDMGFSRNSCIRALNSVGGSNVELAMGWVFEHNMDPDFNDPLPDGNEAPIPSSDAIDEGVVQSLTASLGAFSVDQVRAALKATDGAADRAADWLFSHMDDLDGAIASLETSNVSSTSAKSKFVAEDGDGKYQLSGMISHIGKNTGSGHYVSHLKKDGKWVIFNDEKVAVSSKPPFPHAYVYLYQRCDTVGQIDTDY